MPSRCQRPSRSQAPMSFDREWFVLVHPCPQILNYAECPTGPLAQKLGTYDAEVKVLAEL